jgi:RNA polymerase sigma-70 factor (ECF subfamily)
VEPSKTSRFRGWLFRIARNLLVNFLVKQRAHPRGSGSSSVQELLEAQPASDPLAEAEFAVEFKRRAFRWAADQVKHEFAEATWEPLWRNSRPVQDVGTPRSRPEKTQAKMGIHA